ncbi:AMP-binding protein [Pilimelia columellifera]|uniref:Carrier domain-containing protein n=1 Tax=Pilimelia columellifera subsp. columellifera TaxID=706583 RepID=A0ABN3NT98_9ACTN
MTHSSINDTTEATAQWLSPDLTIPAMIEAVAVSTPHATALVRSGQSCSYAELMRRSAAVARGLVAASVSQGDVVVVRGGRSIDTVVAMLGVLRAGATLTMVDVAQNHQRAQQIVDRAEPRLIVDTAETSTLPPLTGPVPVSSGDLERSGEDNGAVLPDVDVAAPAYLCFTSGTTGEPRGVLGWHGALAQFCSWEQRALEFGPDDRVGQLAALTFDAVFKDLFPALIGGATVCLPPTDQPFIDLAKVLQWLRDDEVTVIQTVPSVLSSLLAEATPGTQLPALRLICLSGEPFRGSPVSRFRSTIVGSGVQFVNLYGTTEATILKSWYRVPDGEVPADVLPIGKPTDGAELLVVNKRGRRCGIGEPGEVLIRTPFLTRGAWRPAAGEAPLFEVNPLNPDDPDDLVQRTGDLGRFGPDGNVEIHGRMDDQIKVLGVRVHPAEVGALIGRHPGVKDAAVVAATGDDDNVALVAYVVRQPDVDLDAMVIRQHVAQHGSNAMVPGHVVFLDRLPLTSHGKLDRAALPRPVAEVDDADQAADTGEWTDVELRVAQVWSEVLKVEVTSRHASFFALGGHSLMMARVLARIRRAFDVELNLQALFSSPTVATLAAAVAEATDAAGSPATELVRVPREEFQRLSPEQEGLWYLRQLEPESAAYHMAGVFSLPADVDDDAVRLAFLQVCERHEALRLRFVEQDGRPVQRTAAAELDFGVLAPAENVAEGLAALQTESAQPFDLASRPPIRVRTILVNGRRLVGLTIHHLCCDGISWSLLTEQVDALLADPTAWTTDAGQTTGPQFRDYVAWRARQAAPARAEADLAFWRAQLGDVPALDLPSGRPQPGSRPHQQLVKRFVLDPQTARGVAARSREAESTEYMTMMTAFASVLARASGQDRIVIGSDSAGRDLEELGEVVGFFVRTHAYCFDMSGNPSFAEALGRVRAAMVAAAGHQSTSFADIVDAVAAERGGDRRPLFSVILRMPPREEQPRTYRLLQPVDVVSTAADGSGSAPTAKFDLTVVVRITEDAATLDLEYDVDALQPELVDALGTRMVELLRFATEQPQTPLARVRHDAHPFSTVLESQAFTPVAELFRGQADRAPDAVAISWEGGQVTYRELAAAVDGAGAEVRPHERVGILGGKTPATVACLIAAIGGGAVPLLLDEALPGPRRQRMLERAGVDRVLQAEPVSATDLPDSVKARQLSFAELTERVGSGSTTRPGAKDAAYLFFTSGTTGESKAVLGSHRGLDHFVDWEAREFDASPQDRVAQFTTLSFDAVLRDVFVPLTRGATLCLPPPQVRDDTRRMLDWLAHERVTIVHTTPSVAASWLREANATTPRLNHLRLLCLAGEPLSGATVAALRDRLLGSQTEVVNFYGPTETTMIKTRYRVPAQVPQGPLPVGQALPGAQMVVVGTDGYPCQPGERGEIVLRTPYRALGYLSDSFTSTAGSVFRPNPFGRDEDDLLYHTGDLAWVDADGQVFVEGRKDDLLKIRGVRVHPAEVGAELASHAEVQQVYVDADKESGEVQLVAYVVRSSGSTLTTESLRQFARQRLPLGLVPSLFIFLDRFALLPNGKLDRSSLSGAAPAHPTDGRVEPRDEVETAVWQAWAQLLGHENFGVTDDFFSVGGHSLLATILITRLRKQLGVSLTLRQLLEAPRVDQLADLVREATAGAVADHASDTALVLRPGEPDGPVLFLVHPIGGDVMCYRQVAAGLPARFKVVGLRAPGLSSGSRYTTIAEMAAAYLHEILQIQPQGPYHLGGWSMGGVVAYEIARQLSFEGADTATLLLLDSYAPGSGAFEHFASPGADRAASFARDLARMTKEEIDARSLVDEAPGSEELDQLRQRFRVFDAHATALVGYRLRRTQLPATHVALVLAGEQSRPDTASPTLGWQEVLHTDIDVRTVPAVDHFTMWQEPGVRDTAAAISAALAAGSAASDSEGA